MATGASARAAPPQRGNSQLCIHSS
ncbi:unnamed protein product [Gulo gulo]|uniref:Uncharacterized protein n=1 Tax=Gulo gulo TaxID=48420 RepID=A0A9X9LYF0_GULGU|nr:unnamed protein product [Gulo gulo]